jgi:hypothetical protein
MMPQRSWLAGKFSAINAGNAATIALPCEARRAWCLRAVYVEARALAESQVVFCTRNAGIVQAGVGHRGRVESDLVQVSG